MKESLELWYPLLIKPWFTPPGWIFGPVWTILYIMMVGLRCFLVWKSGAEGRKGALLFFGVQLFLNFLWTPAFFGLRSALAGMVVISLLLLAIAITNYLFFKKSKTAGILMLPYLAWVSFATILNGAILSLELVSNVIVYPMSNVVFCMNIL